MATESVQQFECGDAQLFGILHQPARPASTGVVVVVGGPQYRVGSHRQFVLLGRALAAAGFAVLRFDYRGMGDSEGEERSFESIDADLQAAIRQIRNACPYLERVVVWGLCDAASAAMMYSANAKDLAGMVLLNPWARTEAGLARARVRHYYLTRLVDPALWRKWLAGELRLGKSLRELLGAVRTARSTSPPSEDAVATNRPQGSFIDRMRTGLAAFKGPVLFVISGNDLTAREWLDLTQRDRRWMRVLARANVVRHDLPDCDHTFSTAACRAKVEALTIEFLRGLDGGAGSRSPSPTPQAP